MKRKTKTQLTSFKSFDSGKKNEIVCEIFGFRKLHGKIKLVGLLIERMIFISPPNRVLTTYVIVFDNHI